MTFSGAGSNLESPESCKLNHLIQQIEPCTFTMQNGIVYSKLLKDCKTRKQKATCGTHPAAKGVGRALELLPLLAHLLRLAPSKWVESPESIAEAAGQSECADTPDALHADMFWVCASKRAQRTRGITRAERLPRITHEKCGTHELDHPTPRQVATFSTLNLHFRKEKNRKLQDLVQPSPRAN